MAKYSRKGTRLKKLAMFTLFITSYAPLLLLIILKQLFQNYSYLSFGGWNLEALIVFLVKFGISVLFILLLIIGVLGFYYTFRNIESRAENGTVVTISEISNKNSEAIGYIATYILPFLYDGFDSLYSFITVMFLLWIIYQVYIKSSMIVINPVISFFYNIYDIKYEVANKIKSGLIISKNEELEEEDKVKINGIGYKIYYSIDYE